MVGSGASSVIDRDPSIPVRLFLNFIAGSLGRAPDLLAGPFDLVAGPIYGLVDLFARSASVFSASRPTKKVASVAVT